MARKPIVLFMLLYSLIALPPGCGGDDAESGEIIDEGDRDDDEFDGVQGSPDDLSGAWAMRHGVAFSTFLPTPINREADFVLVWTGRYNLVHEDGVARAEEDACELTLKMIDDEGPTNDFGVLFTQRSIELIPLESFDIPISGAGAGATLAFPRRVNIYGSDLALWDDPAADAMPEDDDDPRVLDWEDDGHPGFTARIMGLVQGDVYVLLRWNRAFSGRVESGQRIAGTVSAEAELGVLGAEISILNQPLPLTPLPGSPANVLEMTRIPATMDCAGILDNAASLFPDFDPVALHE